MKNIVTSNLNTYLINPIEHIFTAYLKSNFNFGNMAQDTPHQIPTDMAINSPSDPAQIITDGTITFNKTGLYEITKEYVIGRTTTLSQAYCYMWDEFNGITPPNPQPISILSNPNNYIRNSITFKLNIISTPYTYKTFIWSGTQGVANGQLHSEISFVFAAGPTASFQISIKRLNI